MTLGYGDGELLTLQGRGLVPRPGNCWINQDDFGEILERSNRSTTAHK